MTGRTAARYSPGPAMPLPDRRWPGRTLTTAPRWLSTDLRDGNQSLVEPMDPARKLVLFDLLVRMGYREIEVGFPSASRAEHDFVRLLIEQERIPDDVRISVLTPARPELIARTVRSLRGAPAATVHLYHATAPLFRELVYGMSRDECRHLAVRGVQEVLRQAGELGGTPIDLEYSPEMFNCTEPDFALEVCEAVMDAWQPGPDRPVILNFPTTVERSTPNVFADQIEHLDRHLSRREHVCLSVHPHNDRGTGVATAELAMLAGAQRIEGCLFGNGERAGNVDLVTLGLNLLTQGIDPGIDFSELGTVRQTVEQCTGIPVHPRHPYGGDLVHTAFSGAHQDAIKKGFDSLASAAERTGVEESALPWRIPYLPIDPQDIGRSYAALVRVNSQSGKGGAAYVLAAHHGLRLPRDLQVEFARTVQERAEALGGEITPARILALFTEEYLTPGTLAALLPGSGRIATTLHVDRAGAIHTVFAECRVGGRLWWGAGRGTDPKAAAAAAVHVARSRAARSVLTTTVSGAAKRRPESDSHRSTQREMTLWS